MKVLVIGGSGVIGWNLLSKFANNIKFTYYKNKTYRNDGIFLDITNREDVLKIIGKEKPDLVIHTSTLTNVDLCEREHDLADSINIQGTENIVEGCKINKSKIIFVSTSFVFDGQKNQYFEDDLKSPSTYYGITKAKGEEIVINSGLAYLILRTDQPYCWNEEWQHTNSVLRVIDAIKSGNKHREIEDWCNCPTYVPEFNEILKKMIDLKLEGIFHVVGSDYISRYEWALEIAKIFELDRNLIEKINSSKLDLSVKRKNICLNNNKVFKKTGIVMSGIKSGMTRMRDEKHD